MEWKTVEEMTLDETLRRFCEAKKEMMNGKYAMLRGLALLQELALDLPMGAEYTKIIDKVIEAEHEAEITTERLLQGLHDHFMPYDVPVSDYPERRCG